MYTAEQIERMGPFELLTRGDELPVFAFKLKDEVKNFTVFDVSAALRERGWQVPAYTFPKNREDLAALRVVVRRGFTFDVADMLLDDLRKQVARLEKLPAPLVQKDQAAASTTDGRGSERVEPATGGLRASMEHWRQPRPKREATACDAIASAAPVVALPNRSAARSCGPSSSSSSSAWSPAGLPAC